MKVKIQDRFLEERASQGITMRELAEKAKVPIGTISRAENGQSISIKSAAKLCEALEQEFNQLFRIEGKKHE